MTAVIRLDEDFYEFLKKKAQEDEIPICRLALIAIGDYFYDELPEALKKKLKYYKRRAYGSEERRNY